MDIKPFDYFSRGMTGIRFEELDYSSGVRITDRVRQERTELQFEQVTDWRQIETRGFPFPVSAAIETQISGFELTPFSSMYLRDTDGRPVLSISPETQQEFPQYEYCLELCAPVKTYVLFSGSGGISASPEQGTVEFDDTLTVQIGARTTRISPQTTITTTSDPTAIMTALSCLGSGIETTSPSRSYSTIRGYPPLLELGSELSIPGGIKPDDSPLTLELPPTLEYIFPVTSLAYYLDIRLKPGDAPRLLIDGDVELELSDEDYHKEVERLFRQLFFLDCLTRTVGHYPFETHAYRELIDDLMFDIGDVYEADPQSRIRSYLSVPFERLEPELPTWGVTAHITPQPECVRALPHLAYQLAFLRTSDYGRLSGFQARQKSMESFMAHFENEPSRIAEDVFDSAASFVQLSPSSNTDTDVWVGDDIPLRANKLLVDGYENRLQREPVDRSTITVNIVCNESWMDGEASISQERYGDRMELPFEIEIFDHLCRAELGDLLETDVDFLHYIGHATQQGLKCHDGYLNIDSVDSIGADMFFLNACQSYQPGIEMVRNGCIGGIVTLSEVTDAEAATIGRTVAKLLNLGFPLRYALLVARRRSIIGGQYLAVGDDSASMVQAESRVPYECSVKQSGDGYELTLRTYPTNRFQLGTLFSPNVGSDDIPYLVGKQIGPFNLSTDELASFLELENAPVQFEGDFYWAYELAAQLR